MKNYHTYLYTGLLLMAGVVLSLVSCTNDEISKQEEPTVRIEAMAANRQHVSMLTRGLPAEYDSYGVVGSEFNYESNNTPIALHFVNEADATETHDASLAWNGLSNAFSWSGDLRVQYGQYYFVSGYMPQGCATSVVWGSNPSASQITFTLNGLSAASEHDLCAVVGVAKETDLNLIDIKNTTVSVERGNFWYGPIADTKNVLYLLMDHIYSRIKLQIKVGAKYNELRRIKLKTVKMVIEMAGNVDVTVTVNGPAASFDFKNPTAQTRIPLIYESKDRDANNNNEIIGTLLKTDEAIDIPAFFAPINLNQPKKFDFIFTYDVYSWNDTEFKTPIRSNCEAQSSWTLTPANSVGLGPGKSYTLQATVEPTYLYQLGEIDIDNPTVNVTAVTTEP